MTSDTNINAPEAATEQLFRYYYDRFISWKALLYAIAQIKSLPDYLQEHCDMLDMCAIARSYALGNSFDDIELAASLWGVECLVGQEIDLWPAGGGPEEGGGYSDEDLARRDAVRASINRQKRQFASTGSLIDAPPSNVVKFLDDKPQEGEAA